MWIVQLALRRPYTFIVAALSLLIVSPLVILRTPTDMFSNIKIRVVSSMWRYTEALAGLPNGQAEDNLWTLPARVRVPPGDVFRRFAQSGSVSPYVKLILYALCQ
jgi:hypothetical protein